MQKLISVAQRKAGCNQRENDCFFFSCHYHQQYRTEPGMIIYWEPSTAFWTVICKREKCSHIEDCPFFSPHLNNRNNCIDFPEKKVNNSNPGKDIVSHQSIPAKILHDQYTYPQTDFRWQRAAVSWPISHFGLKPLSYFEWRISYWV